MRYLITNADDFGYSDDINQAIIDSHLFGILSSTSVIINTISNQGIELIKSTPTLGFGLHLNLTKGEAITKKWRDKYGELYRPNRGEANQFDQELWVEFFSHYDPKFVYDEFKAQLELFIDKTGQPPTHLDSHHYVSTYPCAFEAYLNLAREYNLPVRNPLILQKASKQTHWGAIILQEKQLKEIKTKLIATPDITSLEYLYQYSDPFSVFKKEISKLEDNQVMEFYFHPGFNEHDRLKDFSFLVDVATKELINQSGITLINFNHFK